MLVLIYVQGISPVCPFTLGPGSSFGNQVFFCDHSNFNAINAGNPQAPLCSQNRRYPRDTSL